MRIREASRRRDFGHMDLEVTVEDPKYYTRPFTVKTELNLISDGDVLEFVCVENEKDRIHSRHAVIGRRCYSGANTSSTLPGMAFRTPTYPEGTNSIPPATTDPADPIDPPFAATPLTV
jgi:hypothetical protein